MPASATLLDSDGMVRFAQLNAAQKASARNYHRDAHSWCTTPLLDCYFKPISSISVHHDFSTVSGEMP